MSSNVYQPPATALSEPGSGNRVPGSGSFRIRVALREGWAATWRNFPMWIGAGIVFGFLSMLSVVTVVGVVLVVPVLGWGATCYALSMVRGRARVGEIFAGFRSYGKALGRMIGFAVVMIGVQLPVQGLIVGAEFSENAALMLLASLGSMAVSLGVLPRLMFAQFYLVDQDLGPLEAFGRSWQRTSTQKLRTLGLIALPGLAAFLVVFPLALVVAVIAGQDGGSSGVGPGMLLGIVGGMLALLFFQVVLYVALASAYRQMEGDPGVEPVRG